ncbi:hypothetical protein [Dactylosporangium sp. CA-139066]|uniref:hypothetical protein n=1 Tax=Dactylosporangium sp. CA-139066 TaxID=3239930 RepID=UPI003D8C70A3
MFGGGLATAGVALAATTFFVSVSAFTFGLIFGFALAAGGGLIIGKALKANTR